MNAIGVLSMKVVSRVVVKFHSLMGWFLSFRRPAAPLARNPNQSGPRVFGMLR